MTDWTGGLIERTAAPAGIAGRMVEREEKTMKANPRKARKRLNLPDFPNPFGLSAHQAQIVQCISTGMSNAEIGESLGLHVKTVESQITVAYLRMQVRSGVEVNRVRAAVLWDRLFGRGAV